MNTNIESIIGRLVEETVRVADPRRIILFGSAARGEMAPDSDLDILVVMPDGVHRRRTARKLYRALAGLGFAKDIVVVTESDLEKYGKNPSLVIRSAIEEGKELYHAS